MLEFLIVNGGIPGGILATLICAALGSFLMHTGQ